jgi:multidrug efflux pump subunit AcrB
MGTGSTDERDAARVGGVLAWFARNPVAANILMLGILLTGVLMATRIRKEVYPAFALDIVNVSMEYRGASPEEVERAIILPIEVELRGMEIIRKVRSTASVGRANIRVELVPGMDRNRGLQEVTQAVQRVNVFPDDAELPVIALESGRRREVVRIAVHGDVDERTLADFAREIEVGMLTEPGISLIEIRGLRRPEIHVEIAQAKLRALELTLRDVAAAIEASALDVPAGTIRTVGGDIVLETTERRSVAREFENIPIISDRDGTRVVLSDIADVRDEFEDSDQESWFDGKRAVFIAVYSADNQSPPEVAEAVRRYIDRELSHLPPTMGITLSQDRSREYNERLDLLLSNGAAGLLLVLLALGLALELRVAFWTAVGIPVSIFGSLALLPFFDASINMISLFGFIVTLGIVVDDAIVVGEAVFYKASRGMGRLEAAIAGVREMAVPVIFAVSTNIIAFVPLLFVPGETGLFFRALPAVIIAVFTVSLTECLLVLPAHLARDSKGTSSNRWRRFQAIQSAFHARIDAAIDRSYGPVVRLAVHQRYVTLSIYIAILGVTIAWVQSGRIDFVFQPTIQTHFVQAEIEMPSGTPIARTREVAIQVERAARGALEKNGEANILVGIFTSIAEDSSSQAEVSVILVPQSERKIDSQQFTELWRAEIGAIPDIETLFFDYLFGPGGSAEIDIQIAHRDIETLRAAASEIADIVAGFPGVEDVRKGFSRAMPQLSFEIKPEGRSLGILARDLGQQIRHAFYGAEALRQPREHDELRVMVKPPAESRRSLVGLEDLLIRDPTGGEIPLHQAATVVSTESPVRIDRVDGSRVVNVTANVIPGLNTGNKILSEISRAHLDPLLARHPGLRVSYEGEQREQREAIEGLSIGLILALFSVFAITAALLRSYVQAFIVMLAIPWSLAGAVMGHIALGYVLSIFSVFGMIALCGMVVNGGFVLLETRNQLVSSGISRKESILIAADRRVRPIILTALTTFLGLAPMIFETSMQALFLIPMAIALGVGTLASAVVVLTLIPASLAIVEDAKRLRLWFQAPGA